MSRHFPRCAFALVLLPLAACRPPVPEPAVEAEGWSVTAWSEHYEVFAETEALVAGREALSHAHFTYLPDFSAVDEGTVTGVLRAQDGREETFHAPAPARPGIFNVPFRPANEGTFELLFRVDNDLAREEIAAGRVRVGSAAQPGARVEPPPGAPGGQVAGEPVAFLKEQQWRTEFATAPARAGALRRSVRAPGRVLAPAGGEATLTAPADGVVTAGRWPHPGQLVRAGEPLFALTPRLSSERGLASLRAEVTALETELATAEARAVRLDELLALEAASLREVEEAKSAVTALAARLDAARQEHAAAGERRAGAAPGPEPFRVGAPIAGRVAEVTVSPGRFVAAGTPLARVVRTSPVWVELALHPADAAALEQSPSGLVLRRWAEDEPALVPAEDLRLVARAPEVAPGTGSVAVLLEVRRDVDQLRLGSRVEAEVLLAEQLHGTLVPSSALVDDGGVDVVYLQLGGESFERREVAVALRQGPDALVRGVVPGERVVVRGGDAVRRSSLLGAGAVEGHVH